MRAATLLVVLAVVVVLALVEIREHRRGGRHVASRGPYGALRVVEAPRADVPGPPEELRELLLERCREADAFGRAP